MEENKLPSFLGQIPFILGAMTDQGRLRTDWIEKAVNEKYYSRYLISPVRKNEEGKEVHSLAGSLAGAFSGFLERNFREHDYALGHYNTYQFLKESFAVPSNNTTIQYYENADAALREKYEAVGWYDPADKHCQIIPRILEKDNVNSIPPVLNKMKREDWEKIKGLILERAKRAEGAALDLGCADGIIDRLIWGRFLKKFIKGRLAILEDEMMKHGMLEKR